MFFLETERLCLRKVMPNENTFSFSKKLVVIYPDLEVMDIFG